MNNAFTRPFKFEWLPDNPPRVIDTNGKVIAVLSTGTLDGPYETFIIRTMGEALADSGNDCGNCGYRLDANEQLYQSNETTLLLCRTCKAAENEGMADYEQHEAGR